MIKLFVGSKTNATKDGRKFKSFFTRVINKDGEEITCKLKFNTDNVDIKEIGYGYIAVAEDNITIPNSFEPHTKANGDTVYPYIWVDSIVSYSESPRKKATQEMFPTEE